MGGDLGLERATRAMSPGTKRCENTLIQLILVRLAVSSFIIDTIKIVIWGLVGTMI